MMPVTRDELGRHLRMYHLARELLAYIENPANGSAVAPFAEQLAKAMHGYSRELREHIRALGGLAEYW